MNRAMFCFHLSLKEYSQGAGPPEIIASDIIWLAVRLALQARQVNQEGELLGSFQVLPVAP